MTKSDKKYKQLLALESGSEDEDTGDGSHNTDVTKRNEDFQAAVGSSSKHALNLKQYARNRSPYSQGHSKTCRCCSPTACAFSFALILVALSAGYLTGFLTSDYWGGGKKLLEDLKHGLGYGDDVRESKPWRTKFSDYGSESCVRLVDVDGDGIDDVIIGLAYGKDVTSMVVESTMDAYCQEQGMKTPCAGAVVALRGYDGKLLWQTVTYAEIFELNCNLVDSNQDGIKDCVASGRLGTIYSIDVKTGSILWEGDTRVLKRGWNIYSATKLPDFNDDGVNDLVIAHGGDPTVAADIHARRSGWLVVLSGATGKSLGHHLAMPEDRETYCAPTLHNRKDGSQYVLFGSGGETVGEMAQKHVN